ncbi:MFS transporter [Azoarcus sp. TTM-91]|uniref:MFS transporter n=1 Tax=Azoarcus sp. TTM-91 TaxID=2691581 RepID=UPI00145D3A7C|nr:MFS transporter [Azoarcus sp. TTM-91]NMG36839.1 MFS transporter [Azoarcus sp. TTM-91]
MQNDIPAPTVRALRVLSLAYFVQATGALSLVGALDAVSREWGLTDAGSAYLISVFGIVFALAAPLLQVFLGHLRRRRQVLLGLGVFSAAALLFAAAPDYPALLLARVLMGLGAAFVGPVLGALGSSLVAREQQGPAIATVLLGLSIAGLVGMPGAAWVAHALGVRLLFVLVGAAGLLCACLILRAVPDAAPGERIRLATVGRLLRDPQSLSGFLVAFFIAAGVYATYGFLAPIIRDVYLAGPETVSLALAVLGVAGVLGNLFVTRMARRYSAEAMLHAGIAVLALSLGLMRLAPPVLAMLFAMLAVFAFATDMLWPSQQRRIIERHPEQRGIALALTSSFVFCGIGAGTALGAWIYPQAGHTGVLLGSLGLLALAVFCLRFPMRSRGAARPCTGSVAPGCGSAC